MQRLEYPAYHAELSVELHCPYRWKGQRLLRRDAVWRRRMASPYGNEA
jgi:hypothetical protein